MFQVEFNALLLQAAADTGALSVYLQDDQLTYSGIVVAGMSAGDLNDAGDIMAEKLVKRGIPIVVAARPYTGSSFPNVHPDAK